MDIKLVNVLILGFGFMFVFTSFQTMGNIEVATLRSVDDNSSDDRGLQEVQSGFSSAIYAMKCAGELFMTRDMLLLSLAFFYSGLELSFFSGVYASSIGFTSAISDTLKEIVGLAGNCVVDIFQKTILDSISEEDESFNGDGYISLAVIYASFAISNWLAPSFLSFTGPRCAMLVGSLTYTLFMVTFLWPRTWLLYLASAILGVGASITWTGQGTFLARCSDQTNISRNSGIFWALLQCSMFFGNLFVYYQFQDKTTIDASTRQLVIGVLIAVAVLGIVFLATLRSVDDNSSDDRELQEVQSGFNSAIYAMKCAGELFMTRDMLLLSLAFFYSGLELSFFSGVYGSSIGFTSAISDTPKEIVGLAGICIGAGEVLGGGLFGLLGSKTTRFGRDPIVITGYIIHLISFFLIFLNLPNSAPFRTTTDVSVLDPPLPWLALLCAFLLGFGDACFNTQIYSMLGGVFVRNSVGAFALFKFTQSVAAAISFFYSPYLGLRAQLGILVIFGTIGTAGFCIVEWAAKKRSKLSQSDTNDSKSDTQSVSSYGK